MNTIADGIEADQKPLRMQSVRAARQRRDARISLWRTSIVSLFFIAVLAAPLYIGSVMLMANIRDQSESTNASARNRTAHFSLPLLDGRSCRNIVFDNKTADLIEDKVERCDQAVSKPKANVTSRFTWGGK
jgi:hypothetical protein